MTACIPIGWATRSCPLSRRSLLIARSSVGRQALLDHEMRSDAPGPPLRRRPAPSDDVLPIVKSPPNGRFHDRPQRCPMAKSGRETDFRHGTRGSSPISIRAAYAGCIRPIVSARLVAATRGAALRQAPSSCGIDPKHSISISVSTRILREGCCPGGRMTKIPASGSG